MQIYRQLRGAGFQVDIDTAPGDTFNKKIRNAQLAQYNYILGNYIYMQVEKGPKVQVI